MTFDMKVRFDTGRKLAMSVGSRPDLLRRVVTIACFCDAGSRPCISGVLTSIVSNGSSRLTDSRTRNVGTGLSMHDLTSDCIMMRCTSVCVRGLNDAGDDDAILDRWQRQPSGCRSNVADFFVQELGEAVCSMDHVAGHVAIAAEQRRQSAPEQ